MYLSMIGSSDPRFKTMRFHEGMNIVLAERSEDSSGKQSRNGAGKSSLVLLMRYLLGGERLDGKLADIKELKDFSYYADVTLREGLQTERIYRSLDGEIYIPGPDDSAGFSMITSAERNWWFNRIARESYSLDSHDGIPDLENLIAQVFRIHFDATKVAANESNWKGTTRLGYFMGFSPESIKQSRQIAEITSQKKAVSHVMRTGAMGESVRNPIVIEAEILDVRHQRDRLAEHLHNFKVDEQYAEHLERANELTRTIRDLSDMILVDEERIRAIKKSMEVENQASDPEMKDKVAAVYDEAGLLLPETALRRYDQVIAFHESVVYNRRLYLSEELAELETNIKRLHKSLSEADRERSETMLLLNSSMALEAYENAQHDLSRLDARLEVLESQLQVAKSLETISTKQDKVRQDAKDSLERQRKALEAQIGEMITEFSDLCSEVYSDRSAYLEIGVTKSGNLSIRPKISGDSSSGIAGVETFLLDMVLLRNAMKLGRAPRIIVHDSALFNDMDERQLGSCLIIASRLAEKDGFQYVAMLNSDTLDRAEGNGFDRSDYIVEPMLSDASEDGGLFGFRFG